MNLLISIKPEFVNKILANEKLYEFRKSIFKQKVDKIFIAIKIDNLHIFDEFIDMDKYDEFRAPQSFCYVENNDCLKELLLV